MSHLNKIQKIKRARDDQLPENEAVSALKPRGMQK